jgi:hypothetical protein
VEAAAGSKASAAALSVAKAELVSAAAKVCAFASATRSSGNLAKYVLCEKLPGAKVNGSLRPPEVGAVAKS